MATVENPTPLSFGDRVGGAASPTKPVTLKNTGDAPLTVTSATASPSVFTVTGCGGALLAPAETCTAQVAFAAVKRGSVVGELIFNTDGGTPKVILAGRGTAPQASPSPTALSFSAPAGTTSAPQRVTLTNTGTPELAGLAVSLHGANYTVVANTCGSTLAPDATCTVDVTFTPPDATAGHAATLRFASDDPDGPADVALQGTGTAAIPPPPPPAPRSPPAPPRRPRRPRRRRRR